MGLHPTENYTVGTTVDAPLADVRYLFTSPRFHPVWLDEVKPGGDLEEILASRRDRQEDESERRSAPVLFGGVHVEPFQGRSASVGIGEWQVAEGR